MVVMAMMMNGWITDRRQTRRNKRGENASLSGFLLAVNNENKESTYCSDHYRAE